MYSIWDLMYRIYLFEQLEIVTEEFIDRALPLLPVERRKKATSYHQLIDRQNCVITYLILKVALKQCFRITDFTLQYGEYGKPFLAEYPNVYFNISHCRYGCVTAVADCPVGVDIQDIRPFSWEVAKKVCCKKELELLEKSPDQSREFTRMWAMKESYAKMIGQGLGCDFISIDTLSHGSMRVIDRKKYVISISDKV